MAKLNYNKSLISDIEAQHTRLIQDEIKRQGLVDTGKMLNSIETNLNITKENDISLEVLAVDYFKYVDGDYDILNNVYNGSGYNAVLEQIEILYIMALEDIIE